MCVYFVAIVRLMRAALFQFLVNGIYLLLFGLAMMFLIGRAIYRQGLVAYIATIKQMRYHEVQNVHI